MPKQCINTAAARTIDGPWSHGTVAGSWIFTSGQVPINPATGRVDSPHVAPQVTQCLHNIEAIVEAGGGRLSDVVKVTVYLRDYHDFAEVNQVYGEFMVQAFPARSCITAGDLPIVDGVPVQCIIEAVAYIGRDT